eukprot:400114_1
MMNYQYPQTYLYENPEPLIKIGPTPPPILPVLDPNEVEQTLYQRRTDPTEADALPQLQINYQTPYYQQNGAIHQQSAPVQNKNTIPPTNTTVLFSKTPQHADQLKPQSVPKPPATPSTPPPPPMNAKLSAKGPSHTDIVAITPQSHANMTNNSASNHSTTSNNTTATTIIESASNHTSHSSHSPHSPQKNVIQKRHIQPKLPSSAVPVPQLANPLPPKPQQLTEGIVIPMDQQNYNALLQHMYPNAVPMVNGVNASYPPHPPSFNVSEASNPRYNPYSQTNYTAQDIYPGYEHHPHSVYYTPPLPANNGYYAAQGHHYYAQQPNTAPAPHILPPNAQYHHIAAPKSADLYNAPPYTPSYPSTYHHGYYNHTHGASPLAQHTTHHEAPKATVVANKVVTDTEATKRNEKVQYLQRCDGTIISPNADPLTVQMLRQKFDGKDEEADAFTAGDDALFGNNIITIINVNWSSNIPFATVRMHVSNRIHHVPLMDLAHIANGKGARNSNKIEGKVMNNSANRYRLEVNNGPGAHVNAPGGGEKAHHNNDNAIGTTVIRRNPKLSDETLMKLPHLRKHREYIRTIDVNMGPKDYNSYRVSVNSKNNGEQNDGLGDNNGRTANIQNLNAKNARGGASAHLNGNLNQNRKKNKRMSACEKGDLFKTELCENWVKKGHCTYGKKCHFAHGRDDIRTRWRIENYKTQPCCDPARADSRLCLFGKRCNYAHPGEPLRRSHHCLYLDEEYQAEILKDYGSTTPYPFGIYI